MIEALILGYPGDEAWRVFALSFADRFDQYPQRHELLAATSDRVPLAQAAAGVVGTNALAWFEMSVPALDAQRPRDIGQSHSQGEIVLRALLMRMPT